MGVSPPAWRELAANQIAPCSRSLSHPRRRTQRMRTSAQFRSAVDEENGAVFKATRQKCEIKTSTRSLSSCRAPKTPCQAPLYSPPIFARKVDKGHRSPTDLGLAAPSRERERGIPSKISRGSLSDWLAAVFQCISGSAGFGDFFSPSLSLVSSLRKARKFSESPVDRWARFFHDFSPAQI